MKYKIITLPNSVFRLYSLTNLKVPVLLGDFPTIQAATDCATELNLTLGE